MKTLQFFDLKGQVSNENMEGRLSPGEFRKVLNAYAIDGDIQSRYGQVALVADPITGSPAITGLGQHRHMGTKILVCVAGSSIYRHSSGGWMNITGSVNLTGNRDDIHQFRNMRATSLGGVSVNSTYLLSTNGVDNLWRWNGTGSCETLDTNTIASARVIGVGDRRVFLGDVTESGARKSSHVAWSEADDPETFNFSSRSKHLPEGGSLITGIAQLGTGAKLTGPIIVFKERGIYAGYPVRLTTWVEHGIEDYRWVYVMDGVGNDAPAGVVAAAEFNRIYFMNVEGIFSLDRSMKVTRVSDPISNEWESLNLARIRTFRGVYIPSLSQVRFYVAYGGATYNNRVLVQNIATGHWQVFSAGTTVNAVTIAVLADGTSTLSTGDYSGMVYRHDNGYTDSGNAITSEVWTDFLNFGNSMSRKQFLEFFLEVDSVANLTFNVDYLIDEFRDILNFNGLALIRG